VATCITSIPKIVAILTSQPAATLGGVEHVVRELVRGLELRGYEVMVLHRGNAAPRWLRHPNGCLVRGFSDLMLSWYLGRKLRNCGDRELAAVITNGPVGWYVPSVKGSSPKKLHFYHGTYRAQAEAIRPFIKHRGYLKLKWCDSMLIERSCGSGKQVLCNSEQTREEVQRFFGHQAITTWCPLDTCHFRPLDQSTCRTELGLPQQGRVALFVGSTHPMKGFPIVRSLMRSLPNVRWLLALRGSVPMDLSGNAGITVFQNAAYDVLPKLYSASDFTVVPSRYEAFGYVVAEAIACGTPPISSFGGASRVFLRESPLDRLLIEDGDDSDSYLVAARAILNDIPRFRQAVIEKARPAMVRTMAPENWWPRFLEVTGL